MMKITIPKGSVAWIVRALPYLKKLKPSSGFYASLALIALLSISFVGGRWVESRIIEEGNPEMMSKPLVVGWCVWGNMTALKEANPFMTYEEAQELLPKVTDWCVANLGQFEAWIAERTEQ